MKQWNKVDKSNIAETSSSGDENEKILNSTGSTNQPVYTLGIDFDCKINRIIEAEADKITKMILSGTQNATNHNHNGLHAA